MPSRSSALMMPMCDHPREAPLPSASPIVGSLWELSMQVYPLA
jgi:hypothetical protein